MRGIPGDPLSRPGRDGAGAHLPVKVHGGAIHSAPTANLAQSIVLERKLGHTSSATQDG